MDAPIYIYTIQYVLSQCNWYFSIDIWGPPSFLFKPVGLRKNFGQQNVGQVIQCDFQSIKSDTISTNSSIYGSLPIPSSSSLNSSFGTQPAMLVKKPRPHGETPHGHSSQQQVSANRQQEPLLMWMNKTLDERSLKPLALPAECLDTTEQKEAISSLCSIKFPVHRHSEGLLYATRFQSNFFLQPWQLYYLQ